MVGDEVGARFYEGRSTRVVGCDEVLTAIHGVADRDVAEGIDEAVLVEDVVCADEEAEGLEEEGWEWGGHFGRWWCC